jgi:hypothetical protein
MIRLPETREIPPYVWVHPDERMQADRNVANKVLADLSPEAQTALTKLKNHFGGGTPLADIRNKISFHYSDKDNLIEKNFPTTFRHGAVGFLSDQHGIQLFLLRFRTRRCGKRAEFPFLPLRLLRLLFLCNLLGGLFLSDSFQSG